MPTKSSSGRRPRLRSTETGRRRRLSASSSSGRLTASSARARAVDDRADKLERRLAAVIDALDALESRVGGLRRSTDERISALERRLDALQRGQGRSGSGRLPDPDKLAQRVTALAIQPVLKAIDQRLAGVEPGARNADADDYNHRHFLALAREVQSLRRKVDDRGGPPPELLSLANSPEFKALLDKKLKTVIGYITEELVPKIAEGAVLKALAAND